MAAIPDATITVSVTDPTGVANTSSVQTDVNGAFSVEFTAGLVGDYTIDVDFPGDANFAPSSGSLIVSVQGIVPVGTTITLTGPTEPVTVGTVVTVTGTLDSATI